VRCIRDDAPPRRPAGLFKWSERWARLSRTQWPGGRVISAQKANTANSFSLPGLALSTANMWSAVQPGGTLFGLQESNPVDTDTAYQGPSTDFGQPNDPMVGQKIGGVSAISANLPRTQ
jgi:hypothetical protein